MALGFSIGALFVKSALFYSMFAMPKLITFALGLVFMVTLNGGGDIKGALVLPASIVLATWGLCTIFSDDKWLSILGRHNSYAMGLLGMWICFAYYLFASTSRGTNRDHEILIFSGVLLGLYAFAQRAGVDRDMVNRIYGHRAFSTLGSPTDCGIILSMIFPLALRKSKICAFAICLGILSTASRGSVLAAIVASAADRKWGN